MGQYDAALEPVELDGWIHVDEDKTSDISTDWKESRGNIFGTITRTLASFHHPRPLHAHLNSSLPAPTTMQQCEAHFLSCPLSAPCSRLVGPQPAQWERAAHKQGTNTRTHTHIHTHTPQLMHTETLAHKYAHTLS